MPTVGNLVAFVNYMAGATGFGGQRNGDYHSLCHRFVDGRNAGLAPRQMYYLNVRNFTIENGSISCSAEQRRCDALIERLP
jgi:hypothetical protein